MTALHNKVSAQELKQRLQEEKDLRSTISFYKYFQIPNPLQLRNELYKSLNELLVFGRIYVAHEGINAQISVPEKNIEAFKTYLNTIDALRTIRLNTAIDDHKSFWVLKIKVREKIVADGISDSSFSMYNKGKYVNAQQMNEMLNEPDTIVIDMRNHYEYEVGHFETALEIPSDTFREQLPAAVEMMKDYKEKNIIMYCTGGIRCEKASAYMLHRGFKNVFHLEGGIINYAKEIKDAGLPSKFKGMNFVFDERLGERITSDIIAKCHQCGNPSDTHVNCANNGCHLLFIQCGACKKLYEACCSKECQQILQLPVEEQKKARQGIDKGQNIFNKSRSRLRPKLNNSK